MNFRYQILVILVILFVGKCHANIMDLTPYERCVEIIKYYETLHKRCNWPYIGYGHQVQPGEPFYKGIEIDEKVAEALLRRDLNKFIKYYEKYGKYSLLLGCLAYNCGIVAVDKSNLIKKIRMGDDDIVDEYCSFCHYKGKFHLGLLHRRIIELRLLLQ